MADRQGRTWLLAGTVLAGVIVVDQLTKHLVIGSIGQGEHRSVLPGLQLVHAVNNGVAFSVAAGGSHIIVVAIGVAVVAIIAYFATHLTRPFLWLPAGLLVGGALGNLVDRIRDGAVTDFIKLPHWPAFNVADMSITIGVVVLLLVLREDGSSRTA